MAKPKVFYSFFYDDDVFRVQQIRNMGVLEGEEPVSKNEWESIQRADGTAAWIEKHMAMSQCVVVLIGARTATRKWVHYEIKRAWESGKGLIGIYVDDLKCPVNGTCSRGSNPFAAWKVGGLPMTYSVTTHDPYFMDAYGTIKNNLAEWVSTAIVQARTRQPGSVAV